MSKLNKRELNNLKYYIAERDRLTKEVAKYKDKLKYGTVSMSFDIAKSNNPNNDTTFDLATHNIKYQKIIDKRIKKLEVLIIRLSRIIQKIDNPELRSIVELRAIKGMTWEQIGEELHMHYSGAQKKYNNFINNQ